MSEKPLAKQFPNLLGTVGHDAVALVLKYKGASRPFDCYCQQIDGIVKAVNAQLSSNDWKFKASTRCLFNRFRTKINCFFNLFPYVQFLKVAVHTLKLNVVALLCPVVIVNVGDQSFPSRYHAGPTVHQLNWKVALQFQ